ncbi:hypothetical protein CFOL_v3_35022, partial [Cephalotus follicularis]
CF